MKRYFRLPLAVLFAALAAFTVMQFEPTQLVALQKIKQKGKNKKPSAPVAGEEEDESKVVFAFDPGSHTRPISALGFNKDQTKLITVGWDYTIQIWSSQTGERLDILRLPAYGRDNGFDSNKWDQAAISPDGAYVAIGGGPKLLYGDKGIPTRLLVVDIVNKRVRKLIFPADPKSPVTCLSFSANGDRLAVGFGGSDNAVYVLDDVIQILKNEPDAKLPSEPGLMVKGMKQAPSALALSPSGNRLALNERNGLVASHDVNGKAVAQWKRLGEFVLSGFNDALEWSPDESQFACSWRKADDYRLELRSHDCKPLLNWHFRELTPGFGAAARVSSFRYLDADRLFISALASNGPLGRGAAGVMMNPKNGKTVRHFFEESGGTYLPYGTTSTAGTLAATTTAKGLEAVVYDLANGKIVSRCGSSTPVPRLVAWAKDAKTPAFAWNDDATMKPWKATAADMKYAFDLAKLEPISKVEATQLELHRLEIGDWKLTHSDVTNLPNYTKVQLKQGDKETFHLQAATGMTLIPNGTKAPLFAHSMHDRDTGMGSNAEISDTTGKVLANLLPAGTMIRDMVSSPDGRYLLISTGTHRLSIYRTDGSRFPFLNYVQANGEWVCWTAEGYYAASPGGEKLIGWAENKGPNEFPLFHPVDRFAKQFHRPDIIKLAFEKGSVAEAVEALKAELPEVETILPPVAKLELVEQRGVMVKVKATATASKPILAMRILHNGRPLKNGQGVWEPVEGKAAEGVFEIQIEGGLSELKVLARTEDGSNASEPLLIRTPKDGKNQPTIHRICIGINDYDESSLKLGSAAKDAEMAYEAFDKYCVGADNRFSSAKGELILNKDATRERIINAIRKTRDEVKLGDLVVIFFAGHGIKQNLPKDPKKPEEIEEKFFLLTREGNPANALTGKSVSGDELSAELAPMICPVLLIFDACHTSAATKSFSPATDAMTRKITDPDVGVTVLCAAMSRETAGATAENGHFTAGLLKALKLGADVPFDPYEKQLYVHHIYSVVYSEVRRATNGKQNPFLNMPWTMPPLPIRDVPVK